MKLTDEEILQALWKNRLVKRKYWENRYLAVWKNDTMWVSYLDDKYDEKRQTLTLQDLAADDWEAEE